MGFKPERDICKYPVSRPCREETTLTQLESQPEFTVSDDVIATGSSLGLKGIGEDGGGGHHAQNKSGRM